MKAQTKITVEQTSSLVRTGMIYTVKKATNTTEWKTGQELTKDQVDSIIASGVTVDIVERK